MSVRELHTQAMDLAEQAEIARHKGDHLRLQRLLKSAYAKEKAAAEMAIQEGAPEPSRCILLKSAAHLAIDCGELRSAEQLIASALSGEPPEEIAADLRLLFEEVGFHRHLRLQGVALHPNDVQMVLVGSAIAPGMASTDEFVGRVSAFQKMIYRTSESDRKIKYRDRGDPAHNVGEPLQLFVSVPRPGSFAVSLKVASENQQAELPFAESSLVLEHLVDRLALYDAGNFAALRNAVPEQEYFDNFVRLAGDLAPDGERVRLVGLTIWRNGKEKALELKRSNPSSSRKVEYVPTEELRKVTGRVFFVNTRDETNPIIKLEADGIDWRLRVDQHQLQQAVRCAAGRKKVTVVGQQITQTMIQVESFKSVPIRNKRKRK